jgi:hypothetical protein
VDRLHKLKKLEHGKGGTVLVSEIKFPIAIQLILIGTKLGQWFFTVEENDNPRK